MHHTESNVSATQNLRLHERSGSLGRYLSFMTPENTTPSTSETPSTSSGAPTRSPAVLSIVCYLILALVIGATIGIWFLQKNIDTQIRESDTLHQEYQAKIDTLKRDPLLQGAEILARSKEDIKKNITRSNPASAIRELDRIHKEYAIQFTGFSLAKDIVTSSVSASRGLEDDAIRKVIKLIGDYRDGTATGSFMLEPVMSVSGEATKRSLGVQFKLK